MSRLMSGPPSIDMSAGEVLAEARTPAAATGAAELVLRKKIKGAAADLETLGIPDLKRLVH